MNMQLRLALGVGVVVIGVVFGAALRSPWMILGHTLVLFSTFLEEKRPYWARYVDFQGGSTTAVLVKTLVSQLVIAGVAYLVGYGASAMIAGETRTAPLQFWDLAALAATLVSSMALVIAIRKVEGGRTPYELALAELAAEEERARDDEDDADEIESDIERAVEDDDRRPGDRS